MNKLLIIIPIIIIAALVIIGPTLFGGITYGIIGTPEIILLSPTCNSTTTQTPTFTFRPEPDPLMYHHYLLKIKKGNSWDDPNFLELNNITHYEISYDEITQTPLEPGDYLYNIVALNENEEGQAGSSPCKFTVII